MHYIALLLITAMALAGCNERNLKPVQQARNSELTLSLYCSGEGEKTVLLLPPLYGVSSSWEGVITGSSHDAKVCALDFITNEELVTGDDIAKLISTVLDQESGSGGVVLVAHSFGGYLARLFYGMTDNIVGVVLVESSHPGMMAAYSPLMSVDSFRVMQDFIDSNPNSIDLVKTEISVRETSGFGHTPLLVLSRGKPGHINDLSTEENLSVNKAWASLQLDLISLSSRSEQRIAKGAGHNIPLEEPATVVEAIKFILSMN
jgi:pimeloyl-ACP methyl ester carboxylesterase